MANNVFARHKYWTGFAGLVIVVGVVVGIVFAILLSGSSNEEEVVQQKSFSIDFEHNSFMKDGQPFQYVSGSFHYFRSLPGSWRRKLQTLRAGGLNAVDLYVQWSLHNPEDGVYNFDGIANVEEVVRIAQEVGLYIILRPGPYICAELDNGGLPYWLEYKYVDLPVRFPHRTNHRHYTWEVAKWYSVLMPRMEKYLYGNGGNIIMVQVENEYGAYGVKSVEDGGTCGSAYKNFLRDETLKYTKDKALLFTTDRPEGDELSCGLIEGVLQTTDFGIANLTEIERNFEKLRAVQPTGPLINSEFYTGWLTHWQEPNSRRSSADLAETLKNMLILKANVNFYMYFGGTNFGFWAGANDWGLGNYMADITSYDYDAPMDEAGNPTEKYMVLRNVIGEFMDIPDESTIPPRAPTMALSAVTVMPINTIFSPFGRRHLETRPFESKKTRTFEQMNQFSGFLLFETELPKLDRDPAMIQLFDLADRAIIYIDDEFVGVLSRENKINTLPISAALSGSKLSILVENQGRINFPLYEWQDLKGLVDSAWIQTYNPTAGTFSEINNWVITGYPFDKFVDVENFVREVLEDEDYIDYHVSPNGYLNDGPVVFYAEFEISEFQDLGDAWWDTEGWGKGFVYVNGFNLGRYWPLVGPQMTMYIPGELLKHGKNEIYIVELQKTPANLKVNFVRGAIFINDEKP